MKKLLRTRGIEARPLTKKEAAEITKAVKRYRFADTLSFWTKKRRRK